MKNFVKQRIALIAIATAILAPGLSSAEDLAPAVWQPRVGSHTNCGWDHGRAPSLGIGHVTDWTEEGVVRSPSKNYKVDRNGETYQAVSVHVAESLAVMGKELKWPSWNFNKTTVLVGNETPVCVFALDLADQEFTRQGFKKVSKDGADFWERPISGKEAKRMRGLVVLSGAPAGLISVGGVEVNDSTFNALAFSGDVPLDIALGKLYSTAS